MSVHLIGVGGAGMSAIARLLLDRGEQVSGSDVNGSAVTDALAAAGATITIGHDAGAVPAGAVVVVSSAIRESNPELARARELGLTVRHRSEALAELMGGHLQVVIAGTHGKTTTTAMTIAALQAAGLDPSYAVGADLSGPLSNAHAGGDDVFVVEADESDESFLRTSPTIAIVTSVEADHLDHYGTLAAIEAAFVRFAQAVRPGGHLVICADDPGAMRLAAAARSLDVTVSTYGESSEADLHVTAVELGPEGASYVPVLAGERLPRLQLHVPGLHNALDSAAALLAGSLLPLRVERLAQGLASFTGARRRFERRGIVDGVLVVDDYAHNPAKVAATVAAARPVAGAGRLIAVFQPHLYSRTRDFAAEFGAALSAADEVILLPIYGAREAPVEGVTSALIAAAVTAVVTVVDGPAAAIERVAGSARAGDLVLLMGAGDITASAQPLLDALGRR